MIFGSAETLRATLSASSFPLIPEWPGIQRIISLVLPWMMLSRILLMNVERFLMFRIAFTVERLSVHMIEFLRDVFASSVALKIAKASVENVEK